MTPVVAITPGEPAGIGPDIMLQQAARACDAKLLCIADVGLMRQRAETLQLNVEIIAIDDIDRLPAHVPNTLHVYPVALNAPAVPGKLDPVNASYVLQCLSTAVDLIRQDSVHALVTGPLHKGVINEAGIAFTGHTEFLADLTDGHPVMMLAADKLRVALATTHLPLNQVSAAITPATLEKVITVLHQDLQQVFRIDTPTILVCGLNPHAGEDGHLGREEIDIIQPALEQLRGRGMKLIGPLPADTLFTPHRLEQADAVLAMYHDQGLPVLKYAGFGRAVNITLGLPIIRTSVDHGTALDLAATGRADSGSLDAALALGVDLARRKTSAPT